MFDDDAYNPVEPFSQDEFVTHSSRELQNLDAGNDEDYRIGQGGFILSAVLFSPVSRYAS